MNERMPHGASIEDALISRMRADLSRQPWYSRWFGKLMIFGGAGLILAGGGIAAVRLLSPEPVTDSFVVHCLSEADVHADGSFPGAAANVASPDGILPVDDAVALCKQMWEAGALGSADPLDANPEPGRAPEEFTTCVTATGEAAIVPGRIECSVLRLHPYQPNVPDGR